MDRSDILADFPLFEFTRVAPSAVGAGDVLPSGFTVVSDLARSCCLWGDIDFVLFDHARFGD